VGIPCAEEAIALPVPDEEGIDTAKVPERVFPPPLVGTKYELRFGRGFDAELCAQVRAVMETTSEENPHPARGRSAHQTVSTIILPLERQLGLFPP
jgi:hypothetical protein